jgi:RNAse (barnase) inhibitor barstar
MIRIDAAKINDWPSFHDAFADTFGFPGYYGRNMDAWIDCMSHLDDLSAEMTAVHTAPGVALTLIVDNAADFKRRCPEQFQSLLECVGFINWRRAARDQPALMALAFDV